MKHIYFMGGFADWGVRGVTGLGVMGLGHHGVEGHGIGASRGGRDGNGGGWCWGARIGSAELRVV
jgi:hypothetical protein